MGLCNSKRSAAALEADEIKIVTSEPAAEPSPTHAAHREMSDEEQHMVKAGDNKGGNKGVDATDGRGFLKLKRT